VGDSASQNLLVHEFSLERDGTSLGTLVARADLNLVYHQVLEKAFVIFMGQFVKTLIVSFLLYFAFQRLFTRHLIRISQDLKRIDPKVSSYQFSLDRKKAKIPVEIDVLVQNLNEMKDSLQASVAAEAELNRNLERKVAEKTDTILKQRQQLEYSAKMSALGEMAGGVAHEVNNPLACIHVFPCSHCFFLHAHRHDHQISALLLPYRGYRRIPADGRR
jgi:C4-dicarboxylate-specific signal transduction histidine kinase